MCQDFEDWKEASGAYEDDYPPEEDVSNSGATDEPQEPILSQ